MTKPTNKKFITKSELIDFLKCRYAYRRALKEGIPTSSVFDSPLAAALKKKGIETEAQLLSALPIKESKFDINNPKDVKKDIVVGGLEVINEALGIKGEPDLVMTAEGKLIPIEIKLHQAENETDPLEIAFYWLAMDPYRQKKVPPEGRYYLAGDREPSFSIVNQTHIAEVTESIREMRQDKEYK